MNTLRELFRAETLDARFVPAEQEKTRNKSFSTKSKWNTLEFYVYGLLFLVFVPLMIITAVSAGSPSNTNYDMFKSRLTDGWMGRPVDNSDAQYSSFRNQFPVLTGLAICHVLLRVSLNCVGLSKRSLYDFVFAILLIFGLHGTGAAKILTILSLNFWIGRHYKRKAFSWVFAVGILFSNELLNGYPLPAGLDYGSVLSQWQVFFKCTMMRMLSYNIDYIESQSAGNGQPDNLKEPLPESHELTRIVTPRSDEEYTFINYVGYCLYAPLYLAGPILSFNDFRAQTNRKLPSVNFERTAVYALRFLICLLCMELILHFIPVVAISETRAWVGLSPAQVSMVGFFNLVVIWLKLLIPWRFFRLWSLVDGIDPPENMIRCVANNYSALSFWRSWHRSFHRWVIRYLYIPLGGSKHQLRNSLIVFAFVALWHDIQLRLFLWGFLIVLFVIPEIVARKIVPFKKYGATRWYRIVAGLGAVGNIWMMLIANLIGFAVGIDGIKDLLYEMGHTALGIRFTILCSLLLYVGAQVMFEYREDELRSGMNLKC